MWPGSDEVGSKWQGGINVQSHLYGTATPRPSNRQNSRSCGITEENLCLPSCIKIRWPAWLVRLSADYSVAAGGRGRLRGPPRATLIREGELGNKLRVCLTLCHYIFTASHDLWIMVLTPRPFLHRCCIIQPKCYSFLRLQGSLDGLFNARPSGDTAKPCSTF